MVVEFIMNKIKGMPEFKTEDEASEFWQKTILLNF